MKRYFFLVILSFLFCNFDASAMLGEDPYAISDRYIQRLHVAQKAQETTPTVENLKTFNIARGAVEAASRVLHASSVNEAYDIATTYSQRLHVAQKAQETTPTVENLETHYILCGATEAASEISHAIGRRAAARIAPAPQPVAPPAPQPAPPEVRYYIHPDNYSNSSSDGHMPGTGYY